MKKELLYLACVILGIILIDGLQFGFDIFSGDTTIDFNVHDTYFVTSTVYVAVFSILLLTSAIYFARLVFTRFKNKFANYTFLVCNALLILSLILICIFLGDFNALIRGDVNETTTREFATSMNKVIANLLYSAYFAIILALFLEIIVIFKTRRLHQDASTI
ncbi:hypothetical protein H2O64_19360 [Kordia sp. YSTF-M3]|uniref:Uncharacterized protein n=1 Tax=Kordia aestuariivivens TaxID=2759037 RepID=A0ABR7QE52_9FLAO|nr:hypothetical protein [Kordia aestuariivivens]MBC8756841.1 hypothetical protein [Kordia aestuariivivens]